MLYVATTYRNYLGVPFKSVRRFDAGAYADAVEKDEERRKRWEIIHKAVVKAGLFAGPAEDGGGQWSKRNEYISAMFMETEWDMEMISEVVGRLRTACRGS